MDALIVNDATHNTQLLMRSLNGYTRPLNLISNTSSLANLDYVMARDTIGKERDALPQEWDEAEMNEKETLVDPMDNL